MSKWTRVSLPRDPVDLRELDPLLFRGLPLVIKDIQSSEDMAFWLERFALLGRMMGELDLSRYEIRRLRALIEAANNAIASTPAGPDEVEHQISSHRDSLPEYTRSVCVALDKAQLLICGEVADMVEEAANAKPSN